MNSGSLVVVSGPSGSGKSSLCKEIIKQFDFTALSISITTRAPREGEKDGVDYFFTTKELFKEAIDRGEFLEWAEVHGNFYGTSKLKVVSALESGKTVLFDIDVQGQKEVARQFAEVTTSAFVTTKDLATLKDRLSGRGTDSSEVIEKRLINALGEMSEISCYDYLIINDDFSASLEVLKAVVVASRYKQSKIELQQFISNWKS